MRILSAVLMAGFVAVAGTAFAQDPAPEAAAPEAAAPEAPAAPETPETPAAAAAAAMPDGNTKGYGNAGCGLGSLLFTPSNGFTQVFAATTNGTSASQTFGITSGTSHCDGAGFQPGSTTAFVVTNRSALAKDAARGKGATITGLAEVAGCTDSKAVGRVLQKNFTQIFPDASVDDTQVSASVISVLKSDATLACGNLS